MHGSSAKVQATGTVSRVRFHFLDIAPLFILCKVLYWEENGSGFDDRHWRQSRSLQLHVGIVRFDLFPFCYSRLSLSRYHGGWLAPNIYYLGGSGCVRLNGIRIAGASGIFKDHDYNRGHFERIPYDNSALRSVYHVRAYDVCKLSLLTPGPEVMISHDWPEGIYRHGNTAALLRAKPFFRSDIEKGELGNPHMMDLMKTLRPSWWFSAHLHVRFQAEYDHTGQGVSEWGKGHGGQSQERSSGPSKSNVVKNTDEIVMDEEDEGDEQPTSSVPAAPSVPVKNTDEIAMDDDDDDGPAAATSPNKQVEEKLDSNDNTFEPAVALPNDATSSQSLPSTTKFLALDKCVPRRRFLEVSSHPPWECSSSRLTHSIFKDCRYTITSITLPSSADIRYRVAGHFQGHASSVIDRPQALYSAKVFSRQGMGHDRARMGEEKDYQYEIEQSTA
jgi:hypothetical protein